MRLSVATNFDDRLIEQIKDYPVFEVYGKLASDVVGGGRASVMLAPVSRKRLRRHIETVHLHEMQFNYLLNASCLDNMELTRRGRRRIHRHLRWLRDLQVDAVTVAIPFLLEFIKEHFPQFKVRVSVFAEADHVLNVKHWATMGADSITLNSPFVNREFATLAKIREAVPRDCELQLLVNNSCLQSCPYTAYHKVLLAHASQSGHRSGGFIVDYCYLKCSFMKLLEPVNYVRADWIRPEDLDRYESLGYETFKLTERNAPTEIMVRRVKAYSERHYEGNLLDLVQPFSYPAERQETTLARLRRFLWLGWYLYRPWTVRWTHLKNIMELVKKRGMLHPFRGTQPVVVDNRSLDGFLDSFPQGGCRNRDCQQCEYCHRWAERALRIDPRYREECLELYERVFQGLLST